MILCQPTGPLSTRMTFKSSGVSEFLERRDLGERRWLVKVAGSCCWIHIASCFPKVALGSWGYCSVSQLCPTLQPHGRQHTRLPCPSPSPRACSNPCPLSELMPYNHPVLCHPLLFLPSICPSIRVFSNESALCIRWPKYWSFSFSISPSKEYSGWFPLRLTDLISSLSMGLSVVFSSTTIWKHQVFSTLLYGPVLTSVHD